MQDILNDRQREAVEAGEGPVLIIAGPGTGKTKTLTARIAHLITAKHVKPQRILALTFTKKAAEEMRQRVQSQLPDSIKTQPTITTFHGFCYDLLGSDTPFISEPKRLQLIKDLPKPASLKGVSARELSLHITRAKNAMEGVDPDVAKLVRAYNKALAVLGVRDYDDLLLDAFTLLEQDEAKRQELYDRYRHILVDEFQDTNSLQYALLLLLRTHDNLFVIGDPNQSIYGFRGSSGTVFDTFQADFPDCRRTALVINYRSAPPIVHVGNAIIAGAEPLQAFAKDGGQVRAVQVLNEYGEAHWVLNHIQRAIGGGDMQKAVSDDDRRDHRRLSDFAVLYRSRRAASTLQKVLAESGLPYQVAGDGSPYDTPTIQAIVELLRASASGEDVDLQGFSSAQQHLLTELLHQRDQREPAILARRVMHILGFEPDRDLQQFLGTLVHFKDIEAAVQYIDTIAEYGFYDPQADAITLMTIHASKGLEFPCVFVVGAEEGILPTALRAGGPAPDRGEERRLFYVAATRAKDCLEILHAKNRGGQPATMSSFIQELSPDILERHADPDMPDQARRIAQKAAKRSQQSLF